MSKLDATIVKALEELGLHQRPNSVSSDIESLEQRLKDYEDEFGSTLDPEILKKYLANS